VLLKVGDPKQKRKKGIFTKQGGDKEVLSTFPTLTSFFIIGHMKIYKEQGLD
jgi:hypothetical protein